MKIDFSIAVIVPAFNAEGFISDCLESIASQTRLPREVIVVDDGSTDQTQSNVLNFKPIGFKLHYIQQKNKGPSSARNAGIRAASSNWIAFLDADDLWIPDKLDKQIGYLKQHPEVSLLCSDASQFRNDRECFHSSHARFGHADFKGIIPKAFETLLQFNPILTGTVLVKKSCLIECGGFDESIRYGEDYDLWLRIALHHSIACQPESLMQRRLHDYNLSRNEEAFYKSSLLIYEKIYKISDKSKKHLSQKECLRTLKNYSYFLYIKNRYSSAIIVLIRYFYHTLRNFLRT